MLQHIKVKTFSPLLSPYNLKNILTYRQTCLRRPPWGPIQSGRLRQVVSLKRFFVEKFADVAEKNVRRRGKTSRAKMTRSSSGTFWSILVQIGGGGPRS